MINKIFVYEDIYLYKGDEYNKDSVKLLLDKLKYRRKIILMAEDILIKSYNYSGNNVDKFIQDKINQDFNNKENLLFHFEVDKENKSVYLYSIRNSIRNLYKDTKKLKIELIQFKVRDYLKRKFKEYINSLVIFKIKEEIYAIKIKSGLIIDTIINKDINIINDYIIKEKNNGYILIKDSNFNYDENISFDYNIDMGVVTYEKIC